MQMRPVETLGEISNILRLMEQPPRKVVAPKWITLAAALLRAARCSRCSPWAVPWAVCAQCGARATAPWWHPTSPPHQHVFFLLRKLFAP